ncbi:bifunctional 4-hydroxy-2-oxoglutarate aldolase/2-dehydro-3-deoxy-phosphogluconate aldolase [Paenibacillus paeoniae]|uniref:Bifunctional 4-hydroxy-2-oxoglutarate aldolase/2-dehydro-3-deoxy-phosphogluconate aldolase n=1 Tax=Paenibacillus paeoniae TaxID=2292705 RepID=A0A371PFG7_9BACL|nr:bifunctional 4-hydroxy-2-oxoglutarate aldolase/2-dehydro-3-deoxy-phosphogluconate aldolase [Paenibacillus paeoniae]REK74672.1 bifunctional 4-hydroxy-2-oxoglutarate aldolase/2-dehydro-3-deoxy-phosphogluconate aldolase [Paenibacillus paeoniae]
MSGMLNELLKHKIVAILRGIENDKADDTARALLEGGIRMMEITMNTDGAAAMINRWRERFDGEAYVGAGTVIDLDTAKLAVQAGAQFLISPNLDEEVIAFGLERGISVWPGVMTPTEIVKAMKAGAEAVKLFPMGTLGINYLKEIRGPLKEVPILATGGVDLDNIAEYFRSGANGVGLGSKLVHMEWVKDGQFLKVAERARAFTHAVSQLS